MNIVTIVGIIHPIVISFVIGTGLGWCLCSLVDILRKYLEMKRHQKKSERTWAELRPYLEHAMDRTADGGLVWLSYDEIKERRNKQNEQNTQQQVRRSTKETSSTT